MTLVAVACQDDRAQILTDTMSYRPVLREVGHVSKAFSQAHAGIAGATRGSSTFGQLWRVTVEDLCHLDAHDLDSLVPMVADAAREVWQRTREMRTDPTAPEVYLVGYSAAGERFAAYGWDAATDFEPFEIHGLHLNPAPLVARPTDVELRYLEDVMQVHADDLAHLRSLDPLPVPASHEGWAAVAMMARQRALMPTETRYTVGVGGSALLISVFRSGVLTEKLFDFDDRPEGEEWPKIIRRSLHPDSQLGPCDCGSGVRYLDCCLDQAGPCLCGSGKTLGECCSVLADTEERAAV